MSVPSLGGAQILGHKTDHHVHEGQVMTGTIVLGGSSRLNREKTGSWQILSQVGGQGYLVSQKVMCEERTR